MEAAFNYLIVEHKRSSEQLLLIQQNEERI
jgi:hypothetical protein